MASEDIIVRMGMDASGFNRGLQQAKVKAKEMGFSFDKLMGAIGLGVAVSWLDKISLKFVDLRRQSEDLSASMAFMSGLSKLEKQFDAPAGSSANAMQKLVEMMGDARSGSEEAQKKFTKFGVSLYDTNGTALSGEEIFKAISSKIEGAGDAAERAAIAFAFFGKAGRDINNILGMGGKGLDEFIAKQGKSEAMLQAQAKNWEQIRNAIKSGSDAVGDFTSKIALGLRVLPSFFAGIARGNVSGEFKKLRGQLNPEEQTRGNRTADTWESEEAALERLNEEAIKTAKIMREIKEISADDKLKLELVDEDMSRLMREIHGLQDGSLERREKELEFAKKQHEWEKLNKKIIEDKNAEQKKAQEFLNKQAEDLLDKTNRMTSRRTELMDDVAKAQTSVEDLSKYTLKELATGNVRGVRDPQLRAEMVKAQQIARLIGIDGEGGEARAALMRGDRQTAARMFTQAEEMKAGLTSLKSSEMSSIARDVSRVNEEVRKFNETAENGFKVFPVFGGKL